MSDLLAGAVPCVLPYNIVGLGIRIDRRDLLVTPYHSPHQILQEVSRATGLSVNALELVTPSGEPLGEAPAAYQFALRGNRATVVVNTNDHNPEKARSKCVLHILWTRQLLEQLARQNASAGQVSVALAPILRDGGDPYTLDVLELDSEARPAAINMSVLASPLPQFRTELERVLQQPARDIMFDGYLKGLQVALGESMVSASGSEYDSAVEPEDSFEARPEDSRPPLDGSSIEQNSAQSQLPQSLPEHQGALEIAIGSGITLRIEPRHFARAENGIVFHGDALRTIQQFSMFGDTDSNFVAGVAARLALLPPRARLRIMLVACWTFMLNLFMSAVDVAVQFHHVGLHYVILAAVLVGFASFERYRAPWPAQLFLWFYLIVVTVGLCVRLLYGNFSLASVVATYAPPVYRNASSAEELIPYVPLDALVADEEVDIDAVVQRMALRPTWIQFLVMFAISWEPSVTDNWRQGVLRRRALHVAALQSARARAIEERKSETSENLID